MKHLITLSIFVALIATSFAQSTADSVDMNMGYTHDVFYSMENGEVAAVDNANWTIAFSTPTQRAAIYINEAKGVSLWQSTADTANFATLDTTGMDWSTSLYNDDATWDKGAYSANATGHPNYGWGVYNQVTNVLTGNKIFILQTATGDYYKTWVKAKAFGEYTYQYASLDNSFDTTIVHQNSMTTDKHFTYYNIDTKEWNDREPAKDTWDILFTRYQANELTFNGTKVTGVFTNIGVEVAEVTGIAVNATIYNAADLEDGSVNKSIIGYDWKAFSPPPMGNGTYSIVDSLSYFVKNADGKIYKLWFTRFDNPSAMTRKSVFNKEMIVIDAIDEIENLDFHAIHPNPAQNQAHLLFTTNERIENASINVYNMIGSQVTNQTLILENGFNSITLDVSTFETGVYFVQISNGKEATTQKLIVK